MRRLILRGEKGGVPGLPPVLGALLWARGVKTPEAAHAFLHPSADQLSDPFLMAGMAEACRVIRRAVDQGRHIVIFGDYDCDGVCASVILQEALEGLGARPEVYLPHRKAEGYGLNEGAVRSLAERCGLLITVDCGITSCAEVALAKELGMDVIVTDHHTVPPEPPAADALLHPQWGEHPCKNLCGAGVAYKLSCALAGRQVLPSLELCALATVADMVPLLGENRTLAALGLGAMAMTRRPGLRALLSVAGIPGGQAVSGTQAAFQLAPRINACGRMDTARVALDLLTAREPLRAMELAEETDRLNARRKAVEQRILQEAETQVQAMDLCRDRAIVVMGEGWESGVVGLVAGRLAERYGYPAVALSREGGQCVGSARSACGVDLYQALAECADLFTRFGGHRQAAGLTLPAERVEDFRARLSRAVAEQLAGRPLMPETCYDAPLALGEVTLELIGELGQMEPFGVGNPAPVFLLQNVDVLSARAVGAEGAHLKMTLSQAGVLLDAVGFRMGEMAAVLQGNCTLAVQPVANTFGGRTAAECRVEAVQGLGGRFPGSPREEALALLQELERFCRNINPLPPDCAPDERAAAIPPPQGVQGTLYLCRTAETAARVARDFPRLDVLLGSAPDPRAYHGVWLCGETSRRGPYRGIVLCDGCLGPGEIACLRTLYPGAQITALPRSAPLRERWAALSFSLEELRACYVDLRRGTRPDGQMPRQAAMAAVLIHMGLMDPAGQLLPVRRCDPQQDLLYQAIQGSDV